MKNNEPRMITKQVRNESMLNSIYLEYVRMLRSVIIKTTTPIIMIATIELSETKGVSFNGANRGRILPVGSVECKILLSVANALMA